MALLVYWATPLQNRFSPAELFMSCWLRTTISATKIGLKPLAPDYEMVKERDRRQKSRQERNFHKHNRARSLTCPEQRDLVWIADHKSEGEVVGEVNPCSYQARSPEGTYRRNRAALHPLPQRQEGNTPSSTEPVLADNQSDIPPPLEQKEITTGQGTENPSKTGSLRTGGSNPAVTETNMAYWKKGRCNVRSSVTVHLMHTHS